VTREKSREEPAGASGTSITLEPLAILAAKGHAPLWNPPIKQNRTAAMRIRLTPSEREKVEAAALVLALGPSSFARMATVKAAGGKAYAAPRRKADAHALALAAWTSQLARIGKTVDELVKTRDAGFDVSQLDVTEIREALSSLRHVVLEFNAKDGA
jgi:hypothetical protein